MANSLIKSNRSSKVDNLLKPKKRVSITDLEHQKKKESNGIQDTTVDTVTFNTNLKISNHTRNKLQAMTNMAYADSQKEAVDIIFNSFFETLSESEKKELLLQINVLEKKDARSRNKK